MKKLFAAALALSLMASLLCGCMCQVADTVFQPDGSGTVDAKFGFSEELVSAMDMSGQMAENGFTYFRYNDHGYYGDQASERFADPDAFNAIFAEVSSEISEVSGPATPGTATLSIASDGGLTLTVQNTQADRRSAIKEELAKEEPSVIISRRPCALLKYVKHNPPLKVNKDKCVGCKQCLKIGCPAISIHDGKCVIDHTQCVGCGICKEMCKLGAICD